MRTFQGRWGRWRLLFFFIAAAVGRVAVPPPSRAEELPGDASAPAEVQAPAEAAAHAERWERVRVKVDVRGELFAPTGAQGQEARKAFTSSARFDFVEAAATNEPGRPEPRAAAHGAIAVRHFFSAAAELSVDGSPSRRSLREAASTLGIVRSPAVRHFAADAYLTPEEIELLLLPFDPLLLDGLVPNVAEEESHREVSPEWTAAVLGLDTIGRSTAPTESGDGTSLGLQSRLVPAEEPGQPDRVVVVGTIRGAVDGVPTTIEVDGRLTLEPDTGHVTQAVVEMREKRLAGHVSPGFDCQATIQMARRPAEGTRAVPHAGEAVVESVRLGWERLRGSSAARLDPLAGTGPGDPARAWTADSNRRFAIIHDVRWRAVAENGRGLVFRMVDDGALLAECTVSPLVPSPAGAEASLEDFRRDVERSLGEKMLRITSEKAARRDDGLTDLRIVSEGAEGGVPLEWRHHLVTAPDGGRVSVMFLVEKRLADRFGDADEQFVAGVAVRKPVEP